MASIGYEYLGIDGIYLATNLFMMMGKNTTGKQIE